MSNLTTLVKDIKVASSTYIKENNLFPLFKHWQEGYAAFTYSIEAKNQLVQYIKNQIQHHQTISFKEEFIQLLKEHHVEFEEKFLI